jgi:hypothetical protein
MESVRKGLRAGTVEKDNYGRLRCTECETELTTTNNSDEVGKLRVCPSCEQSWKELG